jgi:hypothetical protein
MKHTVVLSVFLACVAGRAEAWQLRLDAAIPIGAWRARSAPGTSYLAVTYEHDDGVSENAIGLNCGANPCPAPGTSDLVWAQYFDTNDPLFANTNSDTITRVGMVFGNPPPPSAPPAGTAYDVYIYDDPNDDSDPSDLTGGHLKSLASNVSVAPDTDTLEPTNVPPAYVSGGFFVVCRMAHQMGTTPPTAVAQWPASLDQSVQSLKRAWAAATIPAGTFDPSTPNSGLALPWTELDSVNLSGVWLMRAEGTGNAPQTFCTAKTGLVCGIPSISAAGVPSATAGSGFTISALPARSCKSGVLLYNTAARPAISFQGGMLCIETMGLRRAGSTNSMGTPGNSCDGIFSLDMNTFTVGAWVVPDCAGLPSGFTPSNPASFLLTAGTTVYTTWWGRDSVGSGSFVSDALSFVQGP